MGSWQQPIRDMQIIPQVVMLCMDKNRQNETVKFS